METRASGWWLAVVCLSLGLGCDPGADPPAPSGTDTDIGGSTGPTNPTASATATSTSTTSATTGSTTPGVDSSSDGSSGTTGDVLGCTANSQCGQDQRCSEAGDCVDLLSAECPVLHWPDGGRDDVVFLGSILPMVPPPFEDSAFLHNAQQLAVDDFNDFGSLPGNRQIAWVGCDSSGGVEAALAAAAHLRDNVDAPAIVGPPSSEAVLEVAQQVTVPAGIFLITPTATAPSLSNFDDENLLWRVTPNDVFQAQAIIDRYTVDLGLDPTASRLLVLAKDEMESTELRDEIGGDLSSFFDNIYFANYPGPETFPTQMELLTAYGEILAQALTQPGVTDAMSYVDPEDHYTHVLLLGTSEVEVFIFNYAALWLQQYAPINPAIPLPRFLVSSRSISIMEPTVLDAGAAGLGAVAPQLLANLRGTYPNVIDPENFAAFDLRYQQSFGGQSVDVFSGGTMTYDAAMSTVFAMLTIPEGEAITGAGIAEGMASLVDLAGTVIDFGDPPSTFVPDARNQLVAGGTVDLEGVSGTLQWDPQSGETRADILGFGLQGTPAAPQLDPSCLYLLDPMGVSGTWLSLLTGMPPCG